MNDDFISLDVKEIICSEDRIVVVKCINGDIFILEPTQDIHYLNYLNNIEIENLKSENEELKKSIAQISLCETLLTSISEEYTLKNYKWDNFSMVGEVFNHPRFSEGQVITTSRIHKIEYDLCGRPEKIITKNSVYKLVNYKY